MAGRGGVKLAIPVSAFLASIKRHRGIVTHIIKELDIHHSTFHTKKRENPEIEKALDEARYEFDESICDMAESVLAVAMRKHEDDMGNALGAAKFVLNNKGRRRGYNSWNEEKQFQALSGLQQYWKDHEIKPNLIERFEAYCKTAFTEANLESKPSDTTN